MLIKDQAICLRANDYSETSQIVTFFTKENGKISAIAKGAKRAKSSFDGTLEPLCRGKIVFTAGADQQLSTLTEFQQAPAFTHLAVNFFALNCSLLATELLNHLTEDRDSHPRLFDSFIDLHENLQYAENENKILGFLVLFQLILLAETGFRLILDRCANCRSRFSAKWNESYFSSVANGLVCRDCQINFPDRIRITKAAACCLADLKLLGNTEKKTLDEIEKILVYHFTELLGKRPKTAKYILAG